QARDRRREDRGDDRRQPGAGEDRLERRQLRREDPRREPMGHRQELEGLLVLRDRQQRGEVRAGRDERRVPEGEDAGVAAEDLQREHDHEVEEHADAVGLVGRPPEGVDERPRDHEKRRERERRPESPRVERELLGRDVHAGARCASGRARTRPHHDRTAPPLIAIRPSGWKTRIAITATNANSWKWLLMLSGSVACSRFSTTPSTNPPSAAPVRLPSPPMTPPTNAISSGPCPMSGATAPERNVYRSATAPARTPVIPNAAEITQFARTPTSWAMRKSSVDARS